MGFAAVELGYDTRLDLIDGIRSMVEQGAVKVNSLHNFAHYLWVRHAVTLELYTMGHADPRVRANAVTHTKNTIEFAAEIGAKKIVAYPVMSGLKNRPTP